MSVSIRTENLTVDFTIYNAPHRSIKKNLLKFATGGRVSSDAGGGIVVRALEDIQIEISEGDRVGLTGHNGSGKSTLLRVFAGVYTPTRGKIEVNGKIASLLDISIGMDPDISGVENIYLRGVLLGLTRGEIKRRMEEIIDFSELGEYIDLPIRTYSSGMLMRLGFSISVCVEADILLMDEWLSVGDLDFVKKAEDRLKALVDKTPILVMASHRPDIVAEVCTRVITMERGQIYSDVHQRVTAIPDSATP